MRIISLAAVALLTPGVISCDQDPLGASTRTILGDYALNRFDEGGVVFYLVDREQDRGGYGALRGTVGQIGWNDRYILVHEQSIEGRWLIIDSQTKRYRQIDENERGHATEVQDIMPLEPSQAWKELG